MRAAAFVLEALDADALRPDTVEAIMLSAAKCKSHFTHQAAANNQALLMTTGCYSLIYLIYLFNESYRMRLLKFDSRCELALTLAIQYLGEELRQPLNSILPNLVVNY